jgi:anti-sigma factor RsiW
MKNDDSCERLLELVNGLIDGDLPADEFDEAQRLVESDPDCRAVYETLKKTIALYQVRRNEVQGLETPEIDWQSIYRIIKEKNNF